MCFVKSGTERIYRKHSNSNLIAAANMIPKLDDGNYHDKTIG